MKSTILIMSILSFLFGGKPQQNSNITVLSTADFKTAITDKKVQLVDVRTKNEFDSGHIKKAVNIDIFDKENFISAFNSYNKEEPIYIYCRSGNRSKKASKTLDSLGFKQIFDLKGGFMAWQ